MKIGVNFINVLRMELGTENSIYQRRINRFMHHVVKWPNLL